VLAGIQTDVALLVQEMGSGVVDFGGEEGAQDAPAAAGAAAGPHCGGGGGSAGGVRGDDLESYLERLGMPLLREASSLAASFAAPSAPPLGCLEDEEQQRAALRHLAEPEGARPAGVGPAGAAPAAVVAGTRSTQPCPRQQLPPGWLSSEEHISGAHAAPAEEVMAPARVQAPLSPAPAPAAGGQGAAAHHGRQHGVRELSTVANGVWGSAGGATGSEASNGQQQQQQQPNGASTGARGAEPLTAYSMPQQQLEAPDGLGPLSSARHRRRWAEQSVAAAPSMPHGKAAACGPTAPGGWPSSGKRAPGALAPVCGPGSAALSGTASLAGIPEGSALHIKGLRAAASGRHCGNGSSKGPADQSLYELPPFEEDGPGPAAAEYSDHQGLAAAVAAGAAPSAPPAASALDARGAAAACALSGAAAVAAAAANARIGRPAVVQAPELGAPRTAWGGTREQEQALGAGELPVEASRGPGLSRQSTWTGLEGPERSVGFWGAAIRGISPEKRRPSTAGSCAMSAAAMTGSAAKGAGAAAVAPEAGGAAAVAAALAAATGRSAAKGWRRLFGAAGPESPTCTARLETADMEEQQQGSPPLPPQQPATAPASPSKGEPGAAGGTQPAAGSASPPPSVIRGSLTAAGALSRAVSPVTSPEGPACGQAPAGSEPAHPAEEAGLASPLRAHARRLPLPGRDGCFAGGAALARRTPSPDKRLHGAAVAAADQGEAEGDLKGGATARDTAGPDSPRGAPCQARQVAQPNSKQGAMAAAAAAAARLRLAQRGLAADNTARGSDGSCGDDTAVGHEAPGCGGQELTHSQKLSEAGRLESEAKAAADRGRLEAAEKLSRKALALLQAAAGPKHPNAVACMGRLASFLSRQGKGAEAEGLFRQVLQHREALLGRQHPQVRPCRGPRFLPSATRGGGGICQERGGLHAQGALLGFPDPRTGAAACLTGPPCGCSRLSSALARP
jgi:hypothetical protein